jgi:L-iditol 2-dehydrogenase
MANRRERYRAAVLPAPGQAVRIEELAAPDLSRGGALLHTLFSEVCGTDVHLAHGRLAGVPYPIVPGHVSVGAIAALGERIVDLAGVPFREGDVVTFLDVHETCGACHACLVSKETTRCPARRVYGITYSAGEGLLGGWSEALWMKPGVKMLRLPAHLAETFIAGGCGLVTAVHAIDRAAIRLGDAVAVLGAGPVGQSLCALAALSGAEEVVAIGAPAARLAFAERMGATTTFGLDVPHEERLSAIRARTRGVGVDVVIEASGSPDAVAQALDLVRDGGRVVVAGHYTDNGPVSIHPHWQLNRKHVELFGCWGSDFSHFHRAVRLLERHAARYPWREMISRRYSLEEAQDALVAVERREVLKALVAPA